jgi:HD-GYP domain-containing protein (c-di-GMP phosphodiesterase class II)
MSVDESVYIAQVAELGESREVIATEDVRALNGTKLLARGARIDRAALDRLLRHKLLKPIDYTTSVKDAVDQATLVTVAAELMVRDTETAALLRCMRDESFPQQAFRRVRLLPVIRNKLSVARHLYPPLFEHSLWVTLAATVIAEQLGWSEPQLEILATAALTHDIGALHIEATRLHRSERLQAEHWRQIHTHSRIGYLILEEFPQYRPHISRAVLEHHERMDGSGYPKGCSGSGISPAGRVLSFADFAVATAQRMGLRHMFTITKTQPRAFDREVVGVLAKAMQRFGDVLQPAVSRVDVDTLRDVLTTVSEILSAAPPKAPPESAPPRLVRNIELLRRAIAHMQMMMHRTGFALTDTDSWIEMLKSDPELHAELESLLQEAHFQLQGLLLELRRRTHPGAEGMAGCEHLRSWMATAEVVVERMRERLPYPLQPQQA